MVLSAVVIFTLTYITISVQRLPYFRLDRTSGALVGAVAMIAFGVLGLTEAYQAINPDTIILLLGMMIIVAYLQTSGFFDIVSSFILKHARTDSQLLFTVIIVSGTLSAFFVNDTVCVMLTPFILTLTSRYRTDPKPYLLALASSANIGSVATLVGNPQNMLVGTFSRWGYIPFFLMMLPIAAIGLIIDFYTIKFFFRKKLNRTLSGEVFRSESRRPDKPLVYKSLAAVLIVIIGLSAGANLAFMSILGASILILIANKRPDEIFARVNWSLLLFFASLFVVVAGINKAGIVANVHDFLKPYFTISTEEQIVGFSFVSLVLSNIVSNVPYVMIVRHWVASFNLPHLMWLVLAMSATFAGNLTVVGSVANMIVLELSKIRAPFKFWEFTKVSGAIALLSWIAGTLIFIVYAKLGVR